MITVPESSTNSAAFTIDPYEAKINGSIAQSTSGVAPEVNVDFATAKAACEAAGKRLCTTTEWVAACKGANNRLFGFQDSSSSPLLLTDICDVARTTNNTPGSLPSLTGAHPKCVTDGIAVFDLIGNLSEWTINPSDVPTASGVAFYQDISVSDCNGGLVDPGSTIIAPTTKSTDLGFRCCKDITTGSTNSGSGSSPPTFPF